MPFLELKIKVEPAFNEILIAELSSVGFDSFFEDDNLLMSYIDEEKFNENHLDSIKNQYLDLFTFSYEVGKLEEKNWNKTWEDNFEHVELDSRCIVRVPNFIPSKKYEFDIVINPAMTFGTGHHETTQLMMAELFELNCKDTFILDVGCGSGILSILAKKLGAKEVFALDIETICVDNTIENSKLNNLNIDCRKSTIQDYQSGIKFDVVLANINKNILINDLPFYGILLKKGGCLLLSGFHENDVLDLVEVSKREGFELVYSKQKGEWMCMKLIKNNA